MEVMDTHQWKSCTRINGSDGHTSMEVVVMRGYVYPAITGTGCTQCGRAGFKQKESTGTEKFYFLLYTVCFAHNDDCYISPCAGHICMW